MIFLDFESRSRADLKTVGGRRYWEHPSSEALVVVWYDDGTDDVGVWSPGDEWPHHDKPHAAHNAFGFDRFAAERYGFRVREWIDTSQLARKAGLPGALDALGIRWCGVPKDKVASRFTKSLSSVRRPPKKHPCYITPPEWRALTAAQKRERGLLPSIDQAAMDRVTAYCASDVEIMVDAWDQLVDWLHVDRDVERLDRVINDRGVAFDSDLASTLLEHDEQNKHEAIETAASALGMSFSDTLAAASSPAQFREIVGTPDAQAATIETLDHPLAVARRATASIVAGKLKAGLARVHDDGRLRDTLRYYGAHTGRWGGRGLQPQNLNRPDKRFEDLDIDAFLRNADGLLNLASLEFALRGTLCAPPGKRLVCADFSSVEARATAWAANDFGALEVFASGRDPYKVAAAGVYGVDYADVTKAQRQVGKVAELACGYQGGAGAFAKFAAGYRLDISNLDVAAIVRAWRGMHKPTVRLWYACERAFLAAAEGHATWAGPFEYAPSLCGKHVACYLPSGRPIVYNDVDVESKSYVGTKGVAHVYGGKLVENAIQGMCRDLLTHAMLGVDAAGLPIVLHVHDEIVCEVARDEARDAYETLNRIMSVPPSWARDFPLAADGWIGERYRK